MTPMMAEHCLNNVGLNPKDRFEIENGEMVVKIIQAALLCKSMVESLEDMDVIPGYIVYDEVKEDKVEEIGGGKVEEIGGDKEESKDEKEENKEKE